MPLRSCSSVTGAACHGFDLRLARARLDAEPSLRRVGIVRRCRARSADCRRRPAPSAAAAARRRTMLMTPKIGPLSHADREVVVVAVRDRAGRIHRLRSHDAADDRAGADAAVDRHARREARCRPRSSAVSIDRDQQRRPCARSPAGARRPSSPGPAACRRSRPPSRGSASAASSSTAAGCPTSACR